MKNKSKKINLLLSGTIMASLVVTPTILMMDNIINISLRNDFPQDGFSLTTKNFEIIDSQIVFGQFQKSNFSTSPSPVISSVSKTLISHENFAMNFLPGSIANADSGTIVANNFSDSTSISLSLPWTGTGTVINTALVPKVVSAQLIGNKLWLIVLGNYDNSNNLTYALQSYTLNFSSIGDIEGISQDVQPISLSIDVSTNPIQTPVIAPVYRNSLIEGVRLDQNQIFVYQQNGLLANNSAGMMKFSARGSVITQEIIDIGNLPDNVKNNAQIMSIFIYQAIGQDDYEYGIYHSYGNEPGVKIAYTSLSNTTSNTIYSEDIKNLNNLDIDNQMAYPKAVKTTTGFELFWTHSRPSPNSNENILLTSKVFSTKLNNDRTPMPINEQPKILNLGEFRAGTRDFALIDYRDNGNFNDGNVYIPVKYKGFGVVSGIDVPSFINWRDTMNDEYWSIRPNQDPNEPNQTFMPAFNILNNQGYQILNPQVALSTAIVESIDVENNEITYLFRSVDNSPMWFYQTRNLKENLELTALAISYNTETVPQIVTQISEQNPAYQEGVTTIQDIRRQIQSATNNYLTLTPGNFGNLLTIQEPIEFTPTENGQKVTASVIYNAGFYENGVFTTPGIAIGMPKVITLIQQPQTFIPLNITVNIQTGFTKSSSNFISRINAEANSVPPTGIPGLIGSSPEDLIQISELYLPSLNRITATENTFTGQATLNFFFTDSNNNPHQSQIILVGFAASQWIIAIVIPIILLLGTTIIATFFFISHKKKKKDMFVALQAGMSLTEKMGNKPPPSIIGSGSIPPIKNSNNVMNVNQQKKQPRLPNMKQGPINGIPKTPMKTTKKIIPSVPKGKSRN